MIMAVKEFMRRLTRWLYAKMESHFIWCFIKEKYFCLGVFQKKIVCMAGWGVLGVGLFYYPVQFWLSSWSRLDEFKTKQKLIRQLSDLSFTLQSESAYSPLRGGLKAFIENQVSFWPGVKALRLKVKKAGRIHIKSHQLNPASAVEVAMDNLNLQEMVQYGRKLERLSPHFKLLALNMQEDSQKNNYFDVSYTIAFFKPSQKFFKTPSQKKPFPQVRPSKKILPKPKVRLRPQPFTKNVKHLQKDIKRMSPPSHSKSAPGSKKTK